TWIWICSSGCRPWNGSRTIERAQPPSTDRSMRMTSMIRIVTAASVAFAAAAALSTVAAMAEPTPPAPGKVTVNYVVPPFQHIYENLKRRKVLEELGEFLAPLKLKRDLALKTVQCNTVNAFYSSADHSLSMCYEMVAEF